ncbi:MAG TPA: fluoride efflux transporter CrcB [Vicinamibacterales bacterium]|jgi:CrcB protein|nr:fluoride efflux transporter CrcB [Vicinamibacterales bacterium]
MRYVMLAIGGALGSIARYQVALVVQPRVPAGFPWGTFVVNLSACLIMGLASTLIADRFATNPNWRFLIPIGFIGAYSTFSTFELDVFLLNSEGAFLVAGAYVIGSVVAGYLALWAGIALARLI